MRPGISRHVCLGAFGSPINHENLAPPSPGGISLMDDAPGLIGAGKGDVSGFAQVSLCL